MRIAFIVSGLEPGRDGVGDYTRRLAGELIRQGHPSIALALNDTRISKPVFEAQIIEDTSVSVLRLPGVMPWNVRVATARTWLGDFAPEWVSLQFVPFGVHPKGLCFGLGKRLATINANASWHIMFHELWLGLGENSSIKHRLWGALQRSIIVELVERLRPRIIHTHAEPYRMALSQQGIKASLLALFGNIPIVKEDGWEDLLKPMLAKVVGKQQERSRLYLAGVFGAVHPEWNAEQAVNAMLPLVQRFQKRLVLVFFGKNNQTPEAFNRLKFSLQDRADVVIAGERTSREISRILQTLDLGLATSPRQVIQKSGSVAAMLEHGLKVLVTRDDWHLRGDDSQPEEAAPNIFSPRQFGLLNTLPGHDLHLSVENNVNSIASQFLETLNGRRSSQGSNAPLETSNM